MDKNVKYERNIGAYAQEKCNTLYESINQSINQDFNSRRQTATRQGTYANMN